MSRYPNEAIRRFDQQFAETPQERAESRTMQRFRQTIGKLQDLVADLSPALDDEGGDFSAEGLEALRRRIANALPPEKCPDWLVSYRDPAVVK
jgi:flagellin-specific chaperone FliS